MGQQASKGLGPLLCQDNGGPRLMTASDIKDRECDLQNRTG